MKVQIHSKKLIKPFTPTPSNLNHHNLSFLDESVPKMYTPVTLYYPCPENVTNKHIFSSTCMAQLETSLSKTLVHFYPLAGRYNKHLQFVDCNDKGVEFIEATVDGHLHEILPHQEKSYPRMLNNFIPCEVLMVDEAMHPLLAIQVTVFKCGGLAIGVCISHRIADAATLSMFLEAWGATTNLNKDENQQDGIKKIFPCFDSAVYFPKRGLPPLNFEAATSPGCKVVTRRFSFHNKAISTLGGFGANCLPTSKLQLVIAVIWKALLGAEKLKDEHSRATHIVQPVNLRNKITTPVLHKHFFGNLCILASVPMMAAENKEIHDLAVQLSNSVKGSIEGWVKMMSADKNDPLLEKNDPRNMDNYYMISSWSRFPFYETDFGWGKPEWASSVNFPCKNTIILMDNKRGDGFEAWVSLVETDMIIFEQDFGIKAFTS